MGVPSFVDISKAQLFNTTESPCAAVLSCEDTKSLRRREPSLPQKNMLSGVGRLCGQGWDSSHGHCCCWYIYICSLKHLQFTVPKFNIAPGVSKFLNHHNYMIFTYSSLWLTYIDRLTSHFFTFTSMYNYDLMAMIFHPFLLHSIHMAFPFPVVVSSTPCISAEGQRRVPPLLRCP